LLRFDGLHQLVSPTAKLTLARLNLTFLNWADPSTLQASQDLGYKRGPCLEVGPSFVHPGHCHHRLVLTPALPFRSSPKPQQICALTRAWNNTVPAASYAGLGWTKTGIKDAQGR
jgi:hypothetical protein